jgi:hypothetical protein
MPKNPDRPKIKYKRVKKAPPPPLTREQIQERNLAKLEKRHRINPAMVTQMILKERGLLTQICRSLKIPRTTLKHYIEKHDECAEALVQAREAMGDKAEKKLFQLIDQGDVRCLLYYLSTVHAARGYGINRAAAAAAGNDIDGRPVYVETVNIIGIPSGTFLPKETATRENLVIDHR